MTRIKLLGLHITIHRQMNPAKQNQSALTHTVSQKMTISDIEQC